MKLTIDNSIQKLGSGINISSAGARRSVLNQQSGVAYFRGKVLK